MTPEEQKKIKKKIENGTIYSEYKYRRWRQRVYKRDGYCCQFPDCKYPKGSLNAHHIYMKWYNPAHIYDIKNGITLCTYHHKYVHSDHSDNYIELLEAIAAQNCKKPKISKKIFGKKRKKKKKVTKKVGKKTKKSTKKKVRRSKKKVVKFKKFT